MNLLALLPVNPFFYVKLAAIVAFISLLGFAHHHIYQSGVDDANAIWQTRVAESEKAAQSRIDDANGQVKLAQQSLESYMNESAGAHYQELKNAQIKNSALRDNVSHRGLFIPASDCPSNSAGQVASASTTVVDQGQGNIRLDDATANALVAITTDGDTRIQQMNIRLDACVDAYGEVEKAVNAQ